MVGKLWRDRTQPTANGHTQKISAPNGVDHDRIAANIAQKPTPIRPREEKKFRGGDLVGLDVIPFMVWFRVVFLWVYKKAVAAVVARLGLGGAGGDQRAGKANGTIYGPRKHSRLGAKPRPTGRPCQEPNKVQAQAAGPPCGAWCMVAGCCHHPPYSRRKVSPDCLRSRRLGSNPPRATLARRVTRPGRRRHGGATLTR